MPVKRLRSQGGFTTVTLMGVLMVGALVVLAGFATVDPDIKLSRSDQDSKQAYAAAESGLQWYMNALGRDNSYYLHCDNPPPPNPTETAPVNQRYSSGPFKWRRLPGEEAKYGIELLAVQDADPQVELCDPSDQYSMIDPSGNMRLRISGRSRGKTRTILATLRRQNFLDYIYFTHFETLDPAAYDDPEDATDECAKFRDDRDSDFCTEIRFVTNDDVLGPMHTNDNILVCGSPQFGRNSRDSIEINGPEPYVTSCGSSPDFVGTLTHPAGQLEMPPSNGSLQGVVQSTYSFVGRTEIVLNGTSMDVKNFARWGDNNWHALALPANGVIYVDNSSCTGGYERDQDYGSEEVGCGNVRVRGTYGSDLTIAADNDIIINGNLTRTSNSLLLGLVANNFVRVYHPVSNDCDDNLSGSIANLTVHAAILALQHSFLVDNWRCGQSLGELTVDGAIAQRFRGPVGTTGGAGYIKNYVYNDRLRYREPPYFLDPVLSSWRISRQNEQLPPMKNLPD
jgi:hypothetical protein